MLRTWRHFFIACEQAHLWATRASSEEQSDPAGRISLSRLRRTRLQREPARRLLFQNPWIWKLQEINCLQAAFRFWYSMWISVFPVLSNLRFCFSSIWATIEFEWPRKAEVYWVPQSAPAKEEACGYCSAFFFLSEGRRRREIKKTCSDGKWKEKRAEKY